MQSLIYGGEEHDVVLLKGSDGKYNFTQEDDGYTSSNKEVNGNSDPKVWTHTPYHGESIKHGTISHNESSNHHYCRPGKARRQKFPIGKWLKSGV